MFKAESVVYTYIFVRISFMYRFKTAKLSQHMAWLTFSLSP